MAMQVALSVGIGLLIGLEREWAKKEIGDRTFAITGMLASLRASTLLLGCNDCRAYLGGFFEWPHFAEEWPPRWFGHSQLRSSQRSFLFHQIHKTSLTPR